MRDMNIKATFLWILSIINMAHKVSGRCPVFDCAGSPCRSYETLDRCVYVGQTTMNWFNAKNLCDSLQMSMLQIKNQQIQVIVEQMNVPSLHWIGARGNPLNSWTWLNGGGDYPVEGGHALQDNCGTLKWIERYSVVPDTFEVVAGMCAIPGHFICRRDDCHSFYEDCLTVIYTPLNWFKAREFCLKHSADLFYVRSGESINQLRNWMKDRVKDGLFFIGLTNKRWSWVDDFTEGMYYTKWADNEPMTIGPTCLQIKPRGSYWKEAACYSKANPICIYNKTPQLEPDIPRTSSTTRSTTRTTTRTTTQSTVKTTRTKMSTTSPTTKMPESTTTKKTLSTMTVPQSLTAVAHLIPITSTKTTPEKTDEGHGHHYIGMTIALVALSIVLLIGAVIVALYLLRRRRRTFVPNSSDPIFAYHAQLHSEPNVYEEINNHQNEACAASSSSGGMCGD